MEYRASMITMGRRTPAAICRVFTVAALVAAPACLLGSCETDRENTLMRSARQRQLGEERAERERLERERDLLRLANDETRAELAAARNDGVRVAAELRTNLVALRHELDRLQRAEQDLAAARTRANEIEAQIAPLRALEATARDQQQLQADAQQKLAALSAEVDAANKRVAEQEAELLPRLQAMQQRLQLLQQLRQALDETGKAAAPAPAPAAAPVEQPKK
jgi:chromosome segregation ATPase